MALVWSDNQAGAGGLFCCHFDGGLAMSIVDFCRRELLGEISRGLRLRILVGSLVSWEVN